MNYSFKAKVWIYPSPAAWFFVNVPKKTSNELSLRFSEFKRGWGSLPVKVTVGKTSWNTSIFPDSRSGTYLLPLKAEVRKKEGIEQDMQVKISIELRLDENL